MRQFISALVVAALCAGSGTASAQFGAVKDGAKKAGSVTKKAGEKTVDAAKETGKATEKGTKKVVGATKDTAQETYICKDGTSDKAVVGSNACKGHGGVKVEAKDKH